MTTWQGDSTSTTDVGGHGPGRPHTWPHSVVRWLFGRGEEEPSPALMTATVVPLPEHLHQP